MKVVGVAEAKNGLSKLLDRTKKEDVIITTWGKPKAVLINIENENLEDYIISHSPKIRESIEDSWTAYKEGKVFTFDQITKKIGS